MNKLVSVIMPSYNHGQFIEYAITSVLNQTYSSFELIIIDDKSVDNSRDIILKYKNQDSRIKVFFHKNNLGIAKTFNQAIEISSGDYICFIASDDAWVKHKLELQVDILNKNKNTISWSEGIIIDKHGKPTGEYFTTIHRNPPKKSGDLFAELLQGNFIFGSSIMIPRECINDIHFYEELRYLNDWLYYIDLARYNNFQFISEPLAYYRIHGENTNKDVQGYVNDHIKAINIILHKYKNCISEKDKACLYYILFTSYKKLNKNLLADFYFIKSLLYNPKDSFAKHHLVSYLEQNFPTLYKFLKIIF